MVYKVPTMKLPKSPPAMHELLMGMKDDPQKIVTIMRTVTSPLVSGKYLHWGKLRHYTPPAGLNLDEWWFGIKSQRQGRSTPLVDKGGNPFQFNLADPLTEYLHEIDFLTGGIIRMPEQVTNTETKDTYLVRSLVEEAFTSSQLEGAASTREIAKELVRHERSPRDVGERMILNNYLTMRMISEVKDEPLSKDLVFRVHRMVTEDALDDPTGSGRFRTADEHRVVGDQYGTVFHDPPRASDLERRMEMLCQFANGEGNGPYIHPAIRSMIIHFWLSYDHPFIDGNGRTARALFYWSMLRHGYWLFEYISISHAILKSPIAYGKAFLHSETDGNDLTYFLIYHAAIVRKAIKDLNASIAERSRVLTALETELRGLVALGYRQKELIGHALRHPGGHYTVESHRASHNVSRQSSNNDLNDLERRGFLKRIRAGREHHFIPAPDLEARLRDIS